jgi:tRNA(Arg) A34 adenosine deaminase TadA
VVVEGWSRLPEHWCCAFRQAWAAYVAGTIPVGAVVVDPHGVVAAEARNRIFDTGARLVSSPSRGSRTRD